MGCKGGYSEAATEGCDGTSVGVQGMDAIGLQQGCKGDVTGV